MNPVEVDEFRRNGFIRLENFFTGAEVAEMKSEMTKLVDAMDPSSHPKSVFVASGDEEKHISDRYFLDSVGKISYFYEAKAICNATGDLLLSKEKALNKVGHALHQLNPIFKRFTFSPKLKEICKSLHHIDPKVVQSMYIFKQPSIGGAVGQHRDSTFLHVINPNKSAAPTLFGVWVAIEAATKENGCLWFLPGSHRTLPAEQSSDNTYRFVRNASAELPLLTFVGKELQDAPEEGFVPVEVNPGDVVLIDGDVLHKSDENRSDSSRHAYTFHVVDLGDGACWAEGNWLQETNEYKFPSVYEST